MELKAGYKQTEVGVIPEDWDTRLLGEGIKLLSGQHVLAQHCNTDEDGVPYITGPADFPEGVIRHTKFTTKPGTICRENDILVTVKGSGAGTLVLSDAEYCISRQLMAIRVTEWNTYYIYFSLLQDASLFGAAATGLIPGLSRTDILNKIIFLPPTKAEQEAIAEALSDADALIEFLEQLIAKKRYIKQGAMQELLTGKKRLPGFSGDWEVKRLGDLCEKITTGKLDASAMKESGEYPFFTCAKEYCWIDKYAFDTEALLVSGNGANVGYVHHYDGKFNAYQRTYVLSGFSSNIQFIKLFMERNLQDRIRVEVNAGNTPYIVMGTLTNMLITLPATLNEQTAIATILSDMDAEIAALETQLTKTRSLKQGMMHNLLTGRIRLP
jgi:type I restriction enzyme S subunit